jgi:hypothetical protein
VSETPAWRYLVPGILFLGLALYMLVTGELHVDKQRTMVISRAANPLLYWPIVAAGTVLGLLAVRASWRAMR